ncbi:MAG: ABC transporter ATP-binding protein [Betaproteobacteria bacterium RIFCSPLOWO2_02_FULL_65_24]|nr:MAG: ABC transporter ATP-binding protein [Betaproteobacteria bacterium RIFCSPLOWO2_02_FULL_65_24]OGA89181.1 MAG: ABC transporter ATP-binding protein [Betaproteobacteria bacterium RIFCSPLOWO2_12_FULL_66_14]
MLELREVDAFYGPAQVLFDVGLACHPGEVCVLLGRNGAGKSTTLKTVMGLVPLTGGAVFFQGKRIDRLPPWTIARSGLGYVPEERRIFADLTVLENLEVGRLPPRRGLASWSRERIFELFPVLAPLAGRRAGHLSGGEQQMLTIARTLMGNPLCVLFDEPSEGLAPVVVDQLAEALRALKAQGLSILLSEQNLHFAIAVADRAHIIEKGAIRYSGAVAELVADEHLRSAYLAM